MPLPRRIGIALVIVGSVVTLAAAMPRIPSPGYSYRLKIDAHVVEPNGKRTEFVALSGHAMVSEKGGRLDIDEATEGRGAMAVRGGYMLYDPTSMMMVSPKDRQILKLSLQSLEQGMSALAAAVPGVRVTISDVAVSLENRGRGEPMLGMATTKYRLIQDYELAATIAAVEHNSTEHVVRDYWIADEKKGFANPFARMGEVGVGAGSAFRELLTRTAEAEREMGRGIPLKTVTTTTSMVSRNEVTNSVMTMEVSELRAVDVDDALLIAPADYKVTDMGAQMKAIAAQNGQGAQTGETPNVDSTASTKPVARSARKAAAKPAAKPAPRAATQPAATDAAAEEARQGLVKALHGMIRRP
jgi:hypothetical protein